MTRSARHTVLALVAVALAVGLITPAQLGGWLADAAAWAIDVGRGVADGAAATALGPR